MFAKCLELQKLNPLQFNTNTEPVILHYFPIAGRGELSKLIAVVGRVEVEVETYDLDLSNPEADYKQKAKELGFEGSGLPILQHSELVLNQSGAIQDYLVGLGNYRVTLEQKAIDDMFSHTLEDAITAAAKVVFKVNTPDTLEPVLKKILTTLQHYIPETGFVHGLNKPTKADLCVLVLLEASLPFGVALEMANCSKISENYPRVKRLVEEIKAYPAVRKYLDSDECTLYRKD